MRIVAIVSTTTRRDWSSICELLATSLASKAELCIETVGSSPGATAAAYEAAGAADIVAAVGGDGTVADVATGIFGSRSALGIVPTGSTNIVAKSLGIPARPAAAVELLAGAHARRRIDVGRSKDRSFLHIAGAGMDAELFNTASPNWKRRLGWLAYLPAAASAIRLKPSEVRVTIDGSEIAARSSLILVANGGSAILPELSIYPGIAVDDGWFDVLVFTPGSPLEIVATLGHAGRRRLDLSPHVVWRRARSVRIDAVPPLAVELDGDPRGSTPRTFDIVPAGIEIVTPAAGRLNRRDNK